MLRRLDAGRARDLGVVASFESSVSYVLGDERMVVLTQTYVEQDTCGAVWEVDELMAVAGESAEIGESAPFWRRCEFGLASRGIGCEAGCTGEMRADLVPDGSTVAYVETTYSATGAATSFAVIDAVTGEELRRLEIEPAFQPAWIDWDGSYAVAGDWDGDARFLIHPDDTVESLIEPTTSASYVLLWREG